MKGFILMLVAIVLSVLLLPPCFFLSLFTVGNVSDYMFLIALSLDKTGNVVCGHILNHTMIKDSYYKFGYTNDTISYAIGRNKAVNNLTRFGKFIDFILNIIDPGHTDMVVQRAIKLKEIKIINK